MKYLFLLLLLSASQVKAQMSFAEFYSFDGTKIAYAVEGKGQPVLLIHGFISSGSSWYETELKKGLVAAGYQVIIPDLRGNGRSEKKLSPASYQDNAEVKDLIALMDHLDIKTYKAIGYSRGAIILAALLTVEDRITKAVLGGMGLDFTNPNWPRRIAFADAFNARAPLNEMTKGAVDYAKSINANLQILGMLQEYQPAPSQKSLVRVKTEILVIAGNTDTDNGDPQALKALFPSASLVIVPGDHNTTYRKAPFAKAVLQFLLHKE